MSMIMWHMVGGRPPAVTASTWNPLDKHSEIILNSGNLGATHPAGTGFKAVRGTQGKSTGDRYFTVTAVDISGGLSGAVHIGIADLNFSMAGGYIGQETSPIYKKSVGLWCKNVLYHNMTGGSGFLSATGYGNGAVIGVRVTFSTFTVRFYNDTTGALLGTFVNGAPWGTFFPAVSLWPTGSVSNLNCGGPFNSLPLGASPWDS